MQINRVVSTVVFHSFLYFVGVTKCREIYNMKSEIVTPLNQDIKRLFHGFASKQAYRILDLVARDHALVIGFDELKCFAVVCSQSDDHPIGKCLWKPKWVQNANVPKMTNLPMGKILSSFNNKHAGIFHICTELWGNERRLKPCFAGHKAEILVTISPANGLRGLLPICEPGNSDECF